MKVKPIEQQERILSLLRDGVSLRAVAQIENISTATARRYRAMLDRFKPCQCGRKAGHRGLCFYRNLEKSARGGASNDAMDQKLVSIEGGVIDLHYIEPDFAPDLIESISFVERETSISACDWTADLEMIPALERRPLVNIGQRHYDPFLFPTSWLDFA